MKVLADVIGRRDLTIHFLEEGAAVLSGHGWPEPTGLGVKSETLSFYGVPWLAGQCPRPVTELQLSNGHLITALETPLWLGSKSARSRGGWLLGWHRPPRKDRPFVAIFTEEQRLNGEEPLIPLSLTQWKMNGSPYRLFLTSKAWREKIGVVASSGKSAGASGGHSPGNSDYRRQQRKLLELSELRKGTLLTAKHPMSDAEWRYPNGVTIPVLMDGKYVFPRRRPSGDFEWEAWPELERMGFRNIRPAHWQFLLDALRGHYFAGSLTPPVTREVNGQRRRAAKPAGNSKAPQTACFAGLPGGDVVVGLSGRTLRLLWKLTLGSTTTWISDSPDVAACYIFIDRMSAEQWVKGEIDFRAAREVAYRFIPHKEGWREQLRTALIDLGLSTDAVIEQVV